MRIFTGILAVTMPVMALWCAAELVVARNEPAAIFVGLLGTGVSIIAAWLYLIEADNEK